MFFQSCLLLAFYEEDKCSRQTLNAGIVDAVCIRESQHSRQYKLDVSLYCLVRIRSYLNAILCLINNKLFYIQRLIRTRHEMLPVRFYLIQFQIRNPTS